MADEIKGKWAWEDYPEVQVKGYEEVPNVANQQRLADINKYLEVADEEVEPEVGQKIKRPLQALGYGVRKYITDPIYKGVDVVAQKGGNKIAEMLGARLSDKDKYGDVDFGKNAEREGYESLGDYFNAKDKYENDYQKYRENLDDPNAWYADANGEDYRGVGLNEPTDADSQFASLTGTKAYEDWQPDTMVGKFIKGASGIAGDMLPSNLEGYAIENVPKVMATLSPAFIKMKDKFNASKKAKDLSVKDSLYSDYAGLADEKRMAMSLENARRTNTIPYGRRAARELQAKRLEELKKQLTPEQYQALLQSGGQDLDFQTTIISPKNSKALEVAKAEREAALNDPAVVKSIERHTDSGVNGRKIRALEKEFQKRANDYHLNPPYKELAEGEVDWKYDNLSKMEDELARLRATNQPKPLPNPAAQRAEAMVRNPQAIYSKQGKTMPRLVEALDGDGVVLLDENNVPVGFIEYNFKDFPKTGIDPREVREAMIELEGINPPVGSEKALPFRPNYASGKAMPSEDTLLNNFMREN